MTTKNPARIQSIDILRGLAMIVMALDHCRDFLHYGVSIGQDPLSFATTTPFLFMTRWVTHFCAPIFVFLSGISIFLYGSKGRSKKQIAFFLLTRGIFLILVEILVIQPLWDFNITTIYLQVIWAIGLSMVILSLLQYLSIKFLLPLGLMILFCHNLLDGIAVESPFWKSVLWSIIHVRKDYLINDRLLFTVAYPFLPWLGLMITGYCAGKLYLPSVNAERRKRILRMTGMGAVLIFILLRIINNYGDLHHWDYQSSTIFTLLDFVNTSKYPPSLLYCLMTIGPALIFLSMLEQTNNAISKRVMVFGKVPFFYYVPHVFVIHSIAILTFLACGHHWNELDFDHFREGSLPEGSGHPLWYVYLVWAAVIVLLYFPCRWYSQYKSTHKQWWLSYI